MPSDEKKAAIGLVNPHALREGTQIPDGAITHSMPIRHRDVFEINTPGAASGLEYVGILLYPGLDGGLSWTIDAQSFSGTNHRYYTNDNTYSGSAFAAIDDPDPPSAGDFLLGLWNIKNEGSYSKWRHISTALRLNLINNFDTNDGWWESARFNITFDSGDWEIIDDPIVPVIPNYQSENVRIRPKGELLNKLDNELNADQKSYNFGALRDIHKMQWTLAHVAQDHEVTTLDEVYSFDGRPRIVTGAADSAGVYATPADFRDVSVDDEMGSDFPGKIKPFQSGAPNGSRYIKDMVSVETFDMIYIRLYGTTTNISGANKSKLIGDLVSHREVIFDQDNELHKYMKPSLPAKPKFQIATKNLNQYLQQNSANSIANIQSISLSSMSSSVSGLTQNLVVDSVD